MKGGKSHKSGDLGAGLLNSSFGLEAGEDDPFDVSTSGDEMINNKLLGPDGRSGNGPNPYATLTDIVNSQQDSYEPDNDSLALYAPKGPQRKNPKVASVLSNLVRYPMGEEPTEELITAESSMLALLRKAPTKLGTMMGVYLPTIQNIFGVILFLRVPWIVGNAGVAQALMIVGICCLTTLLTSLSMSAIATNGVVPAGGSYFMISRALGPEFGGAVGILFYLATTFASAMYILGAIELLLIYIVKDDMSAFGHFKPGDAVMLNNLRLYGTVLLSILAAVVFVGVKYVNRFSSVCLIAVIMSILAFMFGSIGSPYSYQPDICLVDGALVQSKFYDHCSYEGLAQYDFVSNVSIISSIKGYPGIASDAIKKNLGATYLQEGEAMSGREGAQEEVTATESTNFFMLLAIFFPSVTGIMAGSNRSGDLKDASQSIPKGTVGAILTTSTVYVLSVIFLGACVEGTLLRDKFGVSIGNKLVFAQAAWPSSWVVVIGALMSCIGAALQTLTGAPRLLQAIAQDKLLPFLSYFGKASSSGEPTRALILTIVIAECGVLIASLDAVAPIITMFFLMCYTFVNIACALQSLLKAPSWRPRYKYYHWKLSALGAALCFFLMVVSSWLYALVATALAGIIYYYIQFKGAAKEWGDGLRGLSIQAARFSLLRLEDDPPHTKNWRPQLLVLSKPDLKPEQDLIMFAGQLKLGKGLTLISSIIEGDFIEKREQAQSTKQATKYLMKQAGVEGFADAIVGQNLLESMSYLIQGSGLGVLKHNTVVIGWPTKWREKNTGDLLVHAIRTTQAANQAIIVPKNLSSEQLTQYDGSIDVYWILHDGGMMLLLAFLLRQDKIWYRCKLRIFCFAEADDNSIQMEQDLELFLRLLRIQAEVAVIEIANSEISQYTKNRVAKMEAEIYTAPSFDVSKSGESNTDSEPSELNLRRMNTSTRMNSIIRERSKGADLIALNLPDVDESDHPWVYMGLLEELVDGLDRVLFVKGGGREVITIYS